MTASERIREARDTPPVGSVWREDDGYLVKVVAVKDEWVYVRAANGRGNAWQVNPAWFKTWERTS